LRAGGNVLLSNHIVTVNLADHCMMQSHCLYLKSQEGTLLSPDINTDIDTNIDIGIWDINTKGAQAPIAALCQTATLLMHKHMPPTSQQFARLKLNSGNSCCLVFSRLSVMLAMDRSTCSRCRKHSMLQPSAVSPLALPWPLLHLQQAMLQCHPFHNQIFFKPARPGRLLEGQSPGHCYPSYCCIRLGQG